MAQLIVPLHELGMDDVASVGGKNASLGEMIRHLHELGVRVPGGFATTSDAFRRFLAKDGLADRINARLEALDVDDVDALRKAGEAIRGWVAEQPLPDDLAAAIHDSYIETFGDDPDVSVAVRSSATAEDLPEASFAGQQETFLNVRGEAEVIARIKEVFASLFNDRAIAYRVHQGFAHADVALSAGVQKMVRSDVGAAGVMFTLDTESGFDRAVFITASYGLGELVVQGAVNPDEFYVYKPALESGHDPLLRRVLGSKHLEMTFAEEAGGEAAVATRPVDAERRRLFSISDDAAVELARIAMTIERHYGRPMDIEWARDGVDGLIYVVQARPETVQSNAEKLSERFSLKERGAVLSEGRSIGQKIGAGRARVVASLEDMGRLEAGEVLVTDMTDPDWEPVMKRASAIVTNRGGRTCHAAIIARELGVPAVVGCGDATGAVTDGAEVTVSCAEGDTGYVYEGLVAFERDVVEFGDMPEAPLKVMMNVGNPDRAFAFSRLPNHGVGLARLEFIVNQMVGVHPRALIEFDTLAPDLKEEIEAKVAAYGDPENYYVRRIAEGVATIAAAFHPAPVIVRLTDFKSNEYANMLGGTLYEPDEENPMLGFRGASRYIADSFRACFELECKAIRYVREQMGLDNVQVMVPFVRTVEEAHAVVDLLEGVGLKRGEKGLKVVMMCELPVNALCADAFLEYFDGFSIGSNDLTQLTLGLDRDSGVVADRFDERNDAVKALMKLAIDACNRQGKYIGICGQGPSDHPDLAEWLMDAGIDSVSLNPDTVVETWLKLAAHRAEA